MYYSHMNKRNPPLNASFKGGSTQRSDYHVRGSIPVIFIFVNNNLV